MIVLELYYPIHPDWLLAPRPGLWGAPRYSNLELMDAIAARQLVSIRWLPNTSDPFLLSRLQAEYQHACDWYDHRDESYRKRVLQAQKRLAQAIRALSEEP